MQTITVRDRREPRQFTIHNRLVDAWYPILGSRGFALYAFYVRLANRKDERAFPGFNLIQEHLGFSRSTIADYNRLLVWSGLILIEHRVLANKRRFRNDYFILPTPVADKDTLHRLRQRVDCALVDEKQARRVKFLEMIIARLDAWQPIQTIWARNKRQREIKVVHAQLALEFLDTVSQGDHPSLPGRPPQSPRETTPVPQGDHPSPLGEPEQDEQNKTNRTRRTEQDEQNTVVASSDVDVLFERLQESGVTGDVARDLVDGYGVVVVEQQLDWFPLRLAEYAAKEKVVKNPVGLLVRSVEGDWTRPAGGEAEVKKDGKLYGCVGCGKGFWSLFLACKQCERCADCCECGGGDGAG